MLSARLDPARIPDITVRMPLPGRPVNYGHLVLEPAALVQGLHEIRSAPRDDGR